MKKIIFILLTLIALTACDNQTISLEVNDPLEYSVNIKNNAEFILIKEGTSIEEATRIIKDNLDIETNADSYEFDWWGEAYSALTREDLVFLSEDYLTGVLNEGRFAEVNEAFSDDITDVSISKKLTLDNESFRPIELIIDFTKDGKTETLYEQILLCVAQDAEYNAIAMNAVTTIENAFIALWNEAPRYSYSELYSIAKKEGHYSNIRAAEKIN